MWRNVKAGNSHKSGLLERQLGIVSKIRLILFNESNYLNDHLCIYFLWIKMSPCSHRSFWNSNRSFHPTWRLDWCHLFGWISLEAASISIGTAFVTRMGREHLLCLMGGYHATISRYLLYGAHGHWSRRLKVWYQKWKYHGTAKGRN